MKLFLSRLLTFGLLALSLTPAWADPPGQRGEIENLKHRLALLEGQPAVKEPPFTLESFGKHLSFNGLVELEAGWEKLAGAGETSDLTLATAQLQVTAEISENVGGHVVFLYEELEGEDDRVVVDEALIHLTHPFAVLGGRIGFYGGRMYLPFGKFNSHFVSDPLTLELGETNDTALYFDYLWHDLVEVKAGIFNGETDTAGDNDSIDSFVVAIEAMPAEGLNFGASYLSDLAESDIELVREASRYNSSVAGAAVFLSVGYGVFFCEVEYLTALENFGRDLLAANAALEEPSDLTGRRPRAWNLEFGLTPVEGWELAFKADRARDFLDDARRQGLVLAHGLFRNTSLAIEYLHSDGKGEGNDPAHTITAQLAFSF